MSLEAPWRELREVPLLNTAPLSTAAIFDTRQCSKEESRGAGSEGRCRTPVLGLPPGAGLQARLPPFLLSQQGFLATPP
jgi:hypothetical protein